jgi:proteasome lid subunit RPN8/RPN11
VLGLRARSVGWRESACIWSGTRDASTSVGRVTHVTFHHELADDHATALSLELPEAAKFSLYQHLAAAGDTLLALLHTHPESWVDLSPIDERNQLSSRIGFWSIVLPHYATRAWRVDDTGFHVRCERGWYRLSAAEIEARLAIEDTR